MSRRQYTGPVWKGVVFFLFMMAMWIQQMGLRGFIFYWSCLLAIPALYFLFCKETWEKFQKWIEK